ncbi:MAG TPA: hypothetical protein VMV17_23240, partial [Streptosporangiaceae bacterium]|nr:hypothetical protein [Streptosporangiaceae bacterium]
MAGSHDGSEPGPATDARGSHGVQIGDHGTQVNTFHAHIGQLIVQPRPAVTAAGPVVVGDVPQEPPAFQPRADLLAALRRTGPGVSVVQAVTGLRGV